MGSLYRSEPLELCQLIVQRDAAFASVTELGKIACVQFKDLNEDVSGFQRKFVNEIRRYSELERCLQFLELQIREAKIPMNSFGLDDIEVSNARDIYRLENRLSEIEKDARQQNEIYDQMRRSLSELIEFQYVLRKVDAFFEVHMDDTAMTELSAAELEEMSSTTLTALQNEFSTPWFIAGVLSLEKRFTFERVLWRMCRRTVFVRSAEIESAVEDPLTGLSMRKCVFIVFFKGKTLNNIISRVCEGFKARCYFCPRTANQRHSIAIETIARVRDTKTVIETTKKQRLALLNETAKRLRLWKNQIYIQKAIYYTLSMCTYDTSKRFLIMECWIAKKDRQRVQQALEKAHNESGATVPPVIHTLETTSTPPTFNPTNKFTSAFQQIVDAYGVPSYREINPAAFTIITFPFLFAIMFADCAHGLILIAAALFFILNERRIVAKHIEDEIFNTFFGGRYVILLMGIFSTYTGFIYNDVFAKSLNIFGSSWVNPYRSLELSSWLVESQKTGKVAMRTFDPLTSYKRNNGPYPIGVDPIWGLAENRLLFLNSMKMKISIIFGVAQMTFGVIISFLNFRYFGSNLDIIAVFVPRITFLFSIFVYLCIQITLKWLFFSAEPGYVFGRYYPGSHCAPSLLIGFINMFMMKDTPQQFAVNNNNTNIVHHCHLAQWYPFQQNLERLLLCIAIFCILMMLFTKPLLVLLKGNAKTKLSNSGILGVRFRLWSEEENVATLSKQHSQSITKHSESVSDLFIYETIHTIEFVLGCISHTASYLRLWALSLAHAQLSEVLWHMLIAQSFGSSGILGVLMTYILFAFYAILTVAILVVMEGLSAFLHALRLHWVEFQSKFYDGSGHPFFPLTLQSTS